jgi:branched-chain amino acid transport system permease protein
MGGGRTDAGALVAVVAALASVPLVVGSSRYLMTLAIGMVVVAGYAVAFNLVFGRTGQLFLCLGALAGVSAYTTVLLADVAGIALPAAVVVGVAASAGIGASFSWVAVRRRLGVIFVGIVTLAFSLVFTNLLFGGRELTGGETGRLVEAGTGSLLRDRVAAYYVLAGVLAVYLVVDRLLVASRFGWAFRALRDDPVAAELAGVDTARARVVAGAVSGGMLGLMGTLFALHDGFLSPTGFDFGDVDVRVLVVLAVGGIGSSLGPVVGAVVVTVVDELLRPLGQLRLTVYGVVLIAVFLRFRQGIVPAVRGAGGRLRDLRGARQRSMTDG